MVFKIRLFADQRLGDLGSKERENEEHLVP